MILLVGALLSWAAPVHAASVAIVAPSRPDPEWTETLTRLRGELLSLGFEVRMVPRAEDSDADGGDSRARLEGIAADGGIDAIIDIVGDVVPVAVDIWVVEQSPPRLEVSRVVREPNARNPSATLAIRAVEVLRSMLLANNMATSERKDESSAIEPQDEVEEPRVHRERFGVELGAAALIGLDGLDPALLPVVQLDWKARTSLVTHVAVAGLGSRPTISTTAGRVRVAQQYGVLGAGYWARSERPWWPVITLSAGALRTEVEGQADLPRQGHTTEEWSFLLDGGLGTGLQLPQRYTLVLMAHAQMAQPYVAIHLVDTIVATTGRPNLALTLTIGAWP